MQQLITCFFQQTAWILIATLTLCRAICVKCMSLVGSTQHVCTGVFFSKYKGNSKSKRSREESGSEQRGWKCSLSCPWIPGAVAPHVSSTKLQNSQSHRVLLPMRYESPYNQTTSKIAAKTAKQIISLDWGMRSDETMPLRFVLLGSCSGWWSSKTAAVKICG